VISGKPFSGTSPQSLVPPSRARAQAGGAVSCTPRSRERAFTLVELVVVLVILSATAGLAVVAAGATMEDSRRTMTVATLGALREAIVGGTSALDTGRCFRRDVGQLPRNTHTAGPLPATWSVCELLDRGVRPVFDPATGRGWRGPYVTAPRAVFGDLDAAAPPSPAGQAWRDHGSPNDWAVLDGWDRPILIQVPDFDGDPAVDTAEELQHARLVSAGSNGRIETPRSLLPDSARYPFFASCGDDIVLYLEVADLRR